jgi:GNAT superfamily N-acetyltransferase
MGAGSGRLQSVSTHQANHFGANYAEHARLPDGTAVTLRAVGPKDKELLRRGFERLSPESRYRRFLGSKRALSDAELAYFTELDGDHHFAIGATRQASGEEEEGLGIARFVRVAGEPEVAEAAVAVVDPWQGRGLGRLLLARLVAAARERGITTFRATLLEDNAAVRAVIAEAGDVRVVEHARGVLAVEVPLPAVPWHESSPPPASGLYRLFRGVARGVAVMLGLKSPRATELECEPTA